MSIASTAARAPRGILIDLDDTLVDEQHSIDVALNALLLAHEVERADAMASWRSISFRHWQRFVAGEIGFQDQRRHRVREFLGRSMSDDDADQAFEPYKSAYAQSLRLLPDVPAFLERTVAIPKVIVTNGTREPQLQKIRATGLDPHFVGVMTPTDCGRWKPHPDIFHAALRIVGLDAADCVMVGDNEVCDVVPARQLGMQAYLVGDGKTLDGLSLGSGHSDPSSRSSP